MTNNRNTLCGTFTALVTPMNAGGDVDLGALDALVDWQLEQGIQGLVPCGTTGESATLDAGERAQVITRVVQRVNGKVPVIAGAGANNTRVAIEHQKRAADTGANYALVVTPYYNKPTDEGLFRHYEALLNAADIPIVLYNVPGRTGCDMKLAATARIAKMEGIAGIKDATGDLDRIAAFRSECPSDFAVLSGDDPTACAFGLLGGDGLISVSSNVAPAAMTGMFSAAIAGEADQARELNAQLRPLFRGLFLESNPIPAKAALALMGRLQANYRLPLTPMADDPKARLEVILKEGGWL